MQNLVYVLFFTLVGSSRTKEASTLESERVSLNQGQNSTSCQLSMAHVEENGDTDSCNTDDGNDNRNGNDPIVVAGIRHDIRWLRIGGCRCSQTRFVYLCGG